MITVLAPAQNTALLTLAKLKSEMGLTDNDDVRDTRLEALIEETSRLIQENLGYSVLREVVQERLTGSARTELMLTRTPVVQLSEVLNEETGESASLTDGTTRISNAKAGLLWTRYGWGDDRPFSPGLTVYPDREPQLGDQPWLITYTCGNLLPSDNTTLSGWELAANMLTPPANVLVPRLVSGEIIQLLDAGTNSRRCRVLARTDDALQIEGSFTDETFTSGTLVVSNMDTRLERFTIEAIKGFFGATGRDPNVSAERIGDWSATYGRDRVGSQMGILPESVQSSLSRMRREA